MSYDLSIIYFTSAFTLKKKKKSKEKIAFTRLFRPSTLKSGISEPPPSDDTHARTPSKMRLSSQTPTSCWLAVYMLISFQNLKECTRHVWCLFFVLRRYIIAVQVSKMEPVAIVDVISDLFLHHWEHECFELCQTQGHHQPFSKHYLLAAATLWSHGLLL